MSQRRLTVLQRELAACKACPEVVGPVVHGPPVLGPVYLLGQAPGPREGQFGRPFAWTAGRTLFRWFQASLGVDEETFRACVYMAAVARCFPGKAARGGGDRKPSPLEVERCRSWITREVEELRPKLILPVGTLAIGEVLGVSGPLTALVGQVHRATWHGFEVDVLPLPHPSGVSTWHRTEPGKTLLLQALEALRLHPAMHQALGTAP